MDNRRRENGLIDKGLAIQQKDQSSNTQYPCKCLGHGSPPVIPVLTREEQEILGQAG